MLRWQHKHGADLPLWRKLIEQGDEPPQAYHDQPDVLPISDFAWQAFTDLSSERGIGMGLGPIPFGAIVRYADLYGLSVDEFDGLRLIIGEVDGFYLAQQSSKSDRDPKVRSLVPISDTAGVSALLSRMGK